MLNRLTQPDRQNEPRTSVRAVPPRAGETKRLHRRRGSVLVLVITLLGILFVTGIAFLTSMEFEAEMIDVNRQRSNSKESVDAAENMVGSILQDATVGLVTSSAGGILAEPFEWEANHPLRRQLGDSVDALGELPGIHNFAAPIEPYAVFGAGPPLLRFRWFTDLGGLRQEVAFRDLEIEAAWLSGVPVDLNGDGVPDFVPVDSDGDGVTDTIQTDLAELGFSRSQIARLSSILNPPALSEATAYLGMRVISHGGLVNLNDSHPALIANVLDNGANRIYANLLMQPTAGLRHRPSLQSLDDDRRDQYRPAIEEPLLRRRVLLPPRIIPMSLLHGNAWGDDFDGYADLSSHIFAENSKIQTGFETVFPGEHRYQPFDYLNELINPNDPTNSPKLWDVFMEPLVAASVLREAEHDRRHLLTTISHDDLLSRAGRAVLFGQDTTGQIVPIDDVDIRQVMQVANDLAVPPVFPACEVPFEYANYPFVAQPTNANCPCPNDPSPACRASDPPDKNLQLSLPSLDRILPDDPRPCEQLALDSPERQLCMSRRQTLIHDVFMMLVRNAHGHDWQEKICTFTGQCLPGEECTATTATGICRDRVTLQSRRSTRIARAAASLTANLIDYMDADDVPTRVAIRNFDFSNPNTVGRPMTTTLSPTPQYVYGLERQPYFAEVATSVLDKDATEPDDYAIEFYNPFRGMKIGGDQDGDGQVDFWIVNEGDLLDQSKWIAWPDPGPSIGDEEFTVFTAGPKFDADIEPSARKVVHPGLEFVLGDIIYLIRKVTIDNGVANVVVDQFLVDGDSIIRDGAYWDGLGAPFEVKSSIQRLASRPIQGLAAFDPIQWKVTVPVTIEVPQTTSLGTWNTPRNPSIRPVEVNFANTGRFSPARDAVTRAFIPGAFPTTGSLLLLMRHANRSFDDFGQTKHLAFNTQLDDTDDAGLQSLVKNTMQIDNGRMPVFDAIPAFNAAPGDLRQCLGGALDGQTCTTPFDCGLDSTCGLVFAHHVDPSRNPADDPNANPPTTAKSGRLNELPWGQLIFDYFTALPLENGSPYDDPATNPMFHAPDALPRVDNGGQRVHGRININAAPWRVLAGLPLIPADNLPPSLNDRINPAIEGFAQLADNTAATIGPALAQGIVAYRDGMAVQGSGNYDVGSPAIGVALNQPDFFARGWGFLSPKVRRGKGFLSVGELANIRHLGAFPEPNPPAGTPNTFSFYRMDRGMVSMNGTAPPIEEDYIGAVAVLVALQDWVTTRSHVFTVYGTLRGERDDIIVGSAEQAQDVDTRALRFQETIDRSPLLMGAQEPIRIGPRYEGSYLDIRND